MTRPLPSIRAPELTAMAVFEPNGAAFLEVCAGAYDVAFSRDQVAALKEKIAAFERASLFEDGRPAERLHRHKEAL